MPCSGDIAAKEKDRLLGAYTVTGDREQVQWWGVQNKAGGSRVMAVSSGLSKEVRGN